jgi:hypothetical protein
LLRTRADLRGSGLFLGAVTLLLPLLALAESGVS